MSKSFKAFGKQVLGAGYEHVWKGIFSAFVIYLSIHLSELRIEIAPVILYLMTTTVTAGMMWQALHSGQQAEKIDGIFQLPFQNRELVFSYIGLLSFYTILRKTLLLLALVFAVEDWTILQIITVMVGAVNACMVAATVNSFHGKKTVLYGCLWGIALLIGIFACDSTLVLLIGMCLSLLLAAVILWNCDAYDFYPSAKQRTMARNYNQEKDWRERRGSVRCYLFRYLMSHKNYLVNTIGLWGMACVFPFFLGQFPGGFLFPIGYALLSMNTPICILLSCNPDLRQAMKMLPRQEERWMLHYGFLLWGIFFISDTIYLIAWQLLQGGVTLDMSLLAVLFSLQSAIGAAWLEWRHPITNWKLESDLWHHPRKYVMPICLLAVAMLVSQGTLGVAAFAVILLIEVGVMYRKEISKE